MPFKTKSLVPYLVVIAVIVIALVLCYTFGTFSADGGGVTGHLEFTF